MTNSRGVAVLAAKVTRSYPGSVIHSTHPHLATHLFKTQIEALPFDSVSYRERSLFKATLLGRGGLETTHVSSSGGCIRLRSHWGIVCVFSEAGKTHVE